MSVDQIQDIEVLRTLVKMQLQESARLKTHLAEALTQLHAKNGPQAEQLALQREVGAMLRPPCGFVLPGAG